MIKNFTIFKNKFHLCGSNISKSLNALQLSGKKTSEEQLSGKKTSEEQLSGKKTCDEHFYYSECIKYDRLFHKPKRLNSVHVKNIECKKNVRSYDGDIYYISGFKLIKIRPLLSFGLLASMPINEDKLATAGSFKICAAKFC